ncbi:hypothetical protein N9937_01430 [bacterium]|nr:hypothetical protein [bacterium]
MSIRVEDSTGATIEVQSITLRHAEREYGWTGQLVLSDPAGYQNLSLEDELSIDLDGEVFSVIVDNKSLQRSGLATPTLTVSVISPTAALAFPRATPLEQTWDTATAASVIADAVASEGIDWTLIDWEIQANRLAVYNASPMNVISTIATAAGGVAETQPDGSLSVRHLWPVAVPRWDLGVVDHVLTDAEHILGARESYRSQRRVNSVLVRGYVPSSVSGRLVMEIDSREGALSNRVPGGQQDVLTYRSPLLPSPVSTLATAGGIARTGLDNVTIVEDVAFLSTNEASLGKPATAVTSVIWMGPSLGTVVLEADGSTLTTPSAGTSIARVTYTASVESWRLSLPTSVSGLTDYAVQVVGSSSLDDSIGDGEVICQRGDGLYSGADVADALLSTTDVKRERGRAELDSGEDLQEVSLECVLLSGIMPGHLIAVHDALMGRSWRGKVTSVSHAVSGITAITSLEVVRRA